MNGVNLCHDCLSFVNYWSKLEGITPFIQLDIDTRYVASNGTYEDALEKGLLQALLL